MMIFKGLLKLWYLCIICIAVLGCHIYHSKANNFFNREGFKDVRSIAVLPFHNITENENAGVIVTNMIMAELVKSGRFRVIKYGDVRNFFMQRRMISVPTIDLETLRVLRQEFKVEVVILGTILRYESSYETGYGNKSKKENTPLLYVSCTILDTRSGRILGKNEFMEKGAARGYLLTNKRRQDPFALTQKLAKKLIATLNIDGV